MAITFSHHRPHHRSISESPPPERRTRNRADRINSVSANMRLNPTHSAPANDSLNAQNLPSNRLRIDVNRIQNSGEDGTVKTTHIVEWNGKKYRLTHVKKEVEEFHIGHSVEDWNKIAQEMTGLWTDMKTSNPQFAFKNGNLNMTDKTWKQRSSDNQNVETVDFNNPVAPYIGLSMTRVENLFTQNRVTSHRMRFERNAPRPRPLGEHNPPPRPTPPVPNPLNPPPPAPDNRPWYKRWASKAKNGAIALKDKIGSVFSRTPVPAPAPAPAPAPVPPHNP